MGGRDRWVEEKVGEGLHADGSPSYASFPLLEAQQASDLPFFLGQFEHVL